MIEDKKQAMPALSLKTFKNRFNAFFLLREQNQQIQVQTLDNNDWKNTSLESLAKASVLARIIVLIPDNETVFKQQSFATDLVSEKNLEEAITLNIEGWMPYEAEYNKFSIIKKIKNQWIVATWLWQQSTQDRLLQTLAEQRITHIMPELAWHCARVSNQSHGVFISQTVNKLAYVYLEQGIPNYIATPKNTAEENRFWRAISSQIESISHIELSAASIATQITHYPEQLEKTVVKRQTASANWLKQAQCKGVYDWINPVNWVKPALAILSLIFIWAIADALLINQQQQKINQLIQSSQKNYGAVIKQQEAIDESYALLNRYAQLKHKQQQVESILVELSTRIPKDIWLDAIQLDQRWLDLRGRGKNVVRLLALLETLQDAEDIVLLNDVRTDARTGEEQFQIRLILKDVGADI